MIRQSTKAFGRGPNQSSNLSPTSLTIHQCYDLLTLHECWGLRLRRKRHSHSHRLYNTQELATRLLDAVHTTTCLMTTTQLRASHDEADGHVSVCHISRHRGLNLNRFYVLDLEQIHFLINDQDVRAIITSLIHWSHSLVYSSI